MFSRDSEIFKEFSQLTLHITIEIKKPNSFQNHK